MLRIYKGGEGSSSPSLIEIRPDGLWAVKASGEAYWWGPDTPRMRELLERLSIPISEQENRQWI